MPKPVAVIIPTSTAVPSAFCAPAPAPLLNASGSTPRIKHRDVIMIGRRRIREASSVAATRSLPPLCNALANPTIKIEFFVTNPINIIKPSKANKLKLLSDKFKAKNAPIAATGIANKATKG